MMLLGAVILVGKFMVRVIRLFCRIIDKLFYLFLTLSNTFVGNNF